MEHNSTQSAVVRLYPGAKHGRIYKIQNISRWQSLKSECPFFPNVQSSEWKLSWKGLSQVQNKTYWHCSKLMTRWVYFKSHYFKLWVVWFAWCFQIHIWLVCGFRVLSFGNITLEITELGLLMKNLNVSFGRVNALSVVLIFRAVSRHARFITLKKCAVSIEYWEKLLLSLA